MILTNLRARYGITPKQARYQLGSLQKSLKEILHALGDLVSKLVIHQDQIFCTETPSLRLCT